MVDLRPRARPIVIAMAVVLAFAGVLAGPAAAAKPAPTYTAVLTTDGGCGFTLRSTWPGSARVAVVYGLWHLDGAFLLTTQAPGTGPNGGTVKGRVATNVTGPFASTAAHDWHVLTQFYDAAGANLFEMNSNTITAPCGVAP